MVNQFEDFFDDNSEEMSEWRSSLRKQISGIKDDDLTGDLQIFRNQPQNSIMITNHPVEILGIINCNDASTIRETIEVLKEIKDFSSIISIDSKQKALPARTISKFDVIEEDTVYEPEMEDYFNFLNATTQDIKC